MVDGESEEEGATERNPVEDEGEDKAVTEEKNVSESADGSELRVPVCLLSTFCCTKRINQEMASVKVLQAGMSLIGASATFIQVIFSQQQAVKFFFFIWILFYNLFGILSPLP